MPSLSDLIDISSDQWVERNADFHKRVEMPALIASETNSNIPSAQKSPQIQIMESVSSTKAGVQRSRITAVVNLQASGVDRLPVANTGIEALVLQGDLCVSAEQMTEVGTGKYIRIPAMSNVDLHSENGCQLFIKFGEMVDSDEGIRHIDTLPSDNWLPGPAEGTEVIPLHVYEGRSILLIRWSEAAWFKPQLDPQGEELFVIKGVVHDALGSYGVGSWIRNPVPVWQAWGGHPGTIAYYKNGHFP